MNIYQDVIIFNIKKNILCNITSGLHKSYYNLWILTMEERKARPYSNERRSLIIDIHFESF